MKKRTKHGGRQKGTPNKRSMEAVARMRRIAKEKYGNNDFDPLDLLLDIALEKDGDMHKYDPSLQFQAAKELASYSYAKLRSFEHKVESHARGVLAVPVIQSKEEFLKRTKKVKELTSDAVISKKTLYDEKNPILPLIDD